MNKTGKPQRICAIDASTNSLAYALFIDKELNQFGKINFEGNNVYEKVGDAARKTLAYFDAVIETDAIVIEHTVFMNSPKTAADLALVQGALLGAAAMYGIKTIGRVSPITWQNYLGNKKLTINYDKTINDNDVADACGIGHWAINNWDKAVGFDK